MPGVPGTSGGGEAQPTESQGKRPYRQTLRAEQAAETLRRMLGEAERLFATETFDRVTLAAVAGAAGVTIPTVQRAFGTKEGLFAAVAARVRERVMAERTPVGDSLDEALDALLAHYERDGTMMWHLLRQEPDVPLLAATLPEARAVHREWVQEVFAASLTGLRGTARARRVDALVAATDLYLWKLLRIDLGRSAVEADATIRRIVHAVARGEDAATR